MNTARPHTIVDPRGSQGRPRRGGLTVVTIAAFLLLPFASRVRADVPHGLVYTPVPPCVLVRTAGSPAGKMAADETREFLARGAATRPSWHDRSAGSAGFARPPWFARSSGPRRGRWGRPQRDCGRGPWPAASRDRPPQEAPASSSGWSSSGGRERRRRQAERNPFSPSASPTPRTTERSGGRSGRHRPEGRPWLTG